MLKVNASNIYQVLPYTGSANNNTDYPIGTIIAVLTYEVNYVRNASAVLKYSSGNTYVFFTSASSGTTLSGTWRARGNSGLSGSAYIYLFQRTE